MLVNPTEVFSNIFGIAPRQVSAKVDDTRQVETRDVLSSLAKAPGLGDTTANIRLLAFLTPTGPQDNLTQPEVTYASASSNPELINILVKNGNETENMQYIGGQHSGNGRARVGTQTNGAINLEDIQGLDVRGFENQIKSLLDLALAQ